MNIHDGYPKLEVESTIKRDVQIKHWWVDRSKNKKCYNRSGTKKFIVKIAIWFCKEDMKMWYLTDLCAITIGLQLYLAQRYINIKLNIDSRAAELLLYYKDIQLVYANVVSTCRAMLS